MPEVVHKNLPVTAKFCPACGKQRGFKRLFNAIQVSTRGHRAARFIDKRMQPAFDEHYKRQSAAKDFEKQATAAVARSVEEAPAAAREAFANANKGAIGMGTGRAVPAAAALGSIDPAARRDSREYTWPAVGSMKPSPKWIR